MFESTSETAISTKSFILCIEIYPKLPSLVHQRNFKKKVILVLDINEICRNLYNKNGSNLKGKMGVGNIFCRFEC